MGAISACRQQQDGLSQQAEDSLLQSVSCIEQVCALASSVLQN